jgi:hypothetical protein
MRAAFGTLQDKIPRRKAMQAHHLDHAFSGAIGIGIQIDQRVIVVCASIVDFFTSDFSARIRANRPFTPKDKGIIRA